ncbi:MAG: hypothetical protein DRP81_08950 [Candidatus Omnitrophota bacterium]|nr:MAG: hypothetical protein DRP81_08950 [Candidatus Omnitrophota bacterium]
MKTISGKDFAKLLEKKGWEVRRVRGSHHIYVKEKSTYLLINLRIWFLGIISAILK